MKRDVVVLSAGATIILRWFFRGPVLCSFLLILSLIGKPLDFEEVDRKKKLTSNTFLENSSKAELASLQTGIEHWEWTITPIPEVKDAIFACDFSSPRNGWAVGHNGQILRWDGTGWSEFTKKNLDHRSLNDVQVISEQDAWAVGDFGTILHWDGNDWTLSEFPEDTELFNVSFYKDFGFAYGRIYSDKSLLQGHTPQVLMKWNNTQWVDAAFEGNWLNDSIQVVSYQDGWMTSEGYMYRWNGNSWALWVSMDPQSMFDSIHDFSVINSTDIWAAGRNSYALIDIEGGGVIIHWNGLVWEKVFSAPYELYTIKMFSKDDGWAIGREFNRNKKITENLILHWDGKTWEVYPSPTKMALSTLCAFDSTTAWIFGGERDSENDGVYHNLALRLAEKSQPTAINNELSVATITTETGNVLITPTPLRTIIPSNDGNAQSNDKFQFWFFVVLIFGLSGSFLFLYRVKRKK